MSAQVLPFRQKPVKGALAPAIDLPRYFCVTCDRTLFVILDDLRVCCANCHRVVHHELRIAAKAAVLV